MSERCEKNGCLGCGACSQICPKGAISLKTDEYGFLAPSINEAKCVHCGLCENVCPVLHHLKLTNYSPPVSYACWNRDIQTRRASSSGGMFSVYADSVLARGGSVYGAIFDETMRVVLRRGTNADEISPMRGSKYVEADPGNVYAEAADDLHSGRPVLFSGTPCQIAALTGYLRIIEKDGRKRGDLPSEITKNLVTLDFICHGVASPSLWANCIRGLEKRWGNRIETVFLRDKASGWKSPSIRYRFRHRRDVLASWSSPRTSLENAFILFYHRNLSLRDSCLRCPFAGLPRMGDITLADYQALYHHRGFADEAGEGISLNLVNSPKGQALFDACRDRFTFQERDLSETGVKNMVPPVAPPRREEFLRDAVTFDFSALFRKYRKIIRPRFHPGTVLNAVLRRLLGRSAARRFREQLEKWRILR